MSDIHKLDRSLFTIKDLREWQPPKVIDLIGSGFLRAQSRLLIFGGEGSWKSMLGMHMGHCLSTGEGFLGFETSVCNVLKVQVEMPLYEDRERALQYSEGHKSLRLDCIEGPTNEDLEVAESFACPSNFIYKNPEHDLHLDNPLGIVELESGIKTCIRELPGRPLVLILDPLYLMTSGHSVDGYDMGKIASNLNRLIKEYKVTIVLIHHARKVKTDEDGKRLDLGSDDQTGSRVMQYWADGILKISETQYDDTFELRFTKNSRNAKTKLPTMIVHWDRETLHPSLVSLNPTIAEPLDIRDLM